MAPKRVRPSGASTSRAQHGARQPQPDLPYMDLDDRNRYDMLGISDDVEYLFARLGWHDFMFTRWPTYPRLVREFLSSLRVEGILSGPHVDRGCITFRFRHIEGHMTLAQFNVIFGLPVGGKGGNHLLLGVMNSGAIVLGGFVTPIALHAGLSLQGYEEAQGRNRVDLATCQAMKMITRMGGQYHLLMPDPLPSIPLRNPARLTIQIRDNWWLQAPTTEAEPDDRPAPPPSAPSHAAKSSRGPPARCLPLIGVYCILCLLMCCFCAKFTSWNV
ncbi:hypothetical protein Salat_0649700 [Sesamum alatum]|uniref:Uncharacterized protein n=1 Tax=Sesamum alatum TaxID=300844 RepID=A0AAE2CUF4_9LAMI|nr:hypothetical protein Salat_0649700 [Sesamum alatum]